MSEADDYIDKKIAGDSRIDFDDPSDRLEAMTNQEREAALERLRYWAENPPPAFVQANDLRIALDYIEELKQELVQGYG